MYCSSTESWALQPQISRRDFESVKVAFSVVEPHCLQVANSIILIYIVHLPLIPDQEHYTCFSASFWSISLCVKPHVSCNYRSCSVSHDLVGNNCLYSRYIYTSRTTINSTNVFISLCYCASPSHSSHNIWEPFRFNAKSVVSSASECIVTHWTTLTVQISKLPLIEKVLKENQLLCD